MNCYQFEVSVAIQTLLVSVLRICVRLQDGAQVLEDILSSKPFGEENENENFTKIRGNYKSDASRQTTSSGSCYPCTSHRQRAKIVAVIVLCN